MNKIGSLLIASIIVVSAIGQEAKIIIPVNYGSMGIEAFQDKSPKGQEMTKSIFMNRATPIVFHQSGHTVQQKLDSVIYESRSEFSGELYISEKDIFIYNTDGKQIESRTYWLNSNTDPSNIFKMEYAYDAFGYPTSYVYYNWDFFSGQWIGISKMEYVWNINRSETQRLYYSWDNMTKVWVCQNKWEFTYDPKGKQIQAILYQWDINSSLWKVIQNEEMTYDSNGHLTQRNQNKTSDVTGRISRIQTMYNLSGEEIQEISYAWNETLQSWDIDSKRESKVNADGKVVEVVRSYKDGTNGLLVEREKFDYALDSIGNIVLSMLYTAYTGKWILSRKWEFISNYNEQFIQEMNYVMDEQTNQVEYGYKTESHYDSNYNITERINYSFDIETSQWVMRDRNKSTYDINRNPLLSIDFNKDSLIEKKTTYYYSGENGSGTEDISPFELKTFPNPASEYITFKMKDSSQPSSIELFDGLGKKMISKMLPLDHKIQVSQFKSGMYFYTIHQNNKTYKGKVIIR